jgi:transcription elongation factor Elf1
LTEKKYIEKKNLFVGHSELEEELKCPHCGTKDQGIVVEDYTNVHSREVLVVCGCCSKLYKIYYKFEKIVKLHEE